METIYLAGGCFWGVQKYFDQFPGVISTRTGYANGNTENPTYEDVRYHQSGHAETVRIDYDPGQISLGELLERYFLVIDPLSVNRQGEDEGSQYRTGIYWTNEKQRPVIEEAVTRLEEKLGRRCAIERCPLRRFDEAEAYHQKYLDVHPDGYCHIPWKMMNLVSADKRRG